jgi:ankyrin repeat protein
MRLLATSLLIAVSLVPAAADDLGDDLLAATRKGDLAQVKALLDKGANVNAKTRYNQTPLFFACDRGHLEIAKLLIDRGADLNVKDNFYNATPLTWAMSKKNKDITVLLIVKGVDPSDALRDAIQSGNKEMLQLILDKGKTDDQMLSDGLELAEAARKTEALEMLKAKGAKAVNYPVTEAALNEYAGSFSDGATTNIDFSVKDGKLGFNQQGFSSPLTAIDKDQFRFVRGNFNFRFVRENGKVTSVELPSRGGVTVLKKKEVSK